MMKNSSVQTIGEDLADWCQRRYKMY